jgi:hypothetical protein
MQICLHQIPLSISKLKACLLVSSIVVVIHHYLLAIPLFILLILPLHLPHLIHLTLSPQSLILARYYYRRHHQLAVQSLLLLVVLLHQALQLVAAIARIVTASLLLLLTLLFLLLECIYLLERVPVFLTVRGLGHRDLRHQ